MSSIQLSDKTKALLKKLAVDRGRKESYEQTILLLLDIHLKTLADG